MRRLRILFSYPAAYRRLLIHGLLLTAAARTALTVLPTRLVLRYVRRRVQQSLRQAEGRTSLFPPERIAWAIRLPGRRVPRASCLTQALAAQMLLAAHGYASRLRIGVGRESDGEFAAHAWVEVHGRVIIGGEIAHRYVALPDFDSLISR